MKTALVVRTVSVMALVSSPPSFQNQTRCPPNNGTPCPLARLREHCDQAKRVEVLMLGGGGGSVRMSGAVLE
ncbi:hypothetical protein Pmani_033089 [Petrolisthes manimaculis]|uniref:Uncharacterized protein n=1 Tax=Petrolisthes manimaculis TaxID=1843537 RepID=A0AAE1TQT2_9EUCA|nr:hypothetical protein Pmani_033089 [Petrolisthes manimaculis]